MQRVVFALILAMAAPAAAQTAIPAADRSVAAAEKSIVTYLVQDSIADVQFGRLGVQKAANPAVRALARTMVADHTQTAADAMSVAGRIGDDAAKAEPDDAGVVTIARLARLSGAAFDRAYAHEAVEMHKSDIALLTKALAVSSTGGIRTLIGTSLAVDRRHLMMANRAAEAVGAAP